jgi:hypothetical protein
MATETVIIHSALVRRNGITMKAHSNKPEFFALLLQILPGAEVFETSSGPAASPKLTAPNVSSAYRESR